LAAEADVSVPTVKRLEAEEGMLGGRSETGLKIKSALQAGGVEFIDENVAAQEYGCESGNTKETRTPIHHSSARAHTARWEQ
jgi:hypothetical protein